MKKNYPTKNNIRNRMSKQFQIDMAHLCTLSYENENKMEEHFTNPMESSEVL